MIRTVCADPFQQIKKDTAQPHLDSQTELIWISFQW